LDNSVATEIFAKGRMLENINQYLNADANSLMTLSNWDRLFKNDVVQASHFLLRFSLLDRLADAFGLPKQPAFSTHDRRVSHQDLSIKFSKVCFSLKFRDEFNSVWLR
jgi:hypothetical protein